MPGFRTLAEAANFTQDQLLSGLATALITSDETLVFADIAITDRPSIKGNREVSRPDVQNVDCDDEIVDSAADTEPFTFPLITKVTQFTSCRQVQGRASTFTDQLAIDIEQGARAMGESLAQDAAIGSGAAGQLYGYEALTPASQIITPAGADLELEDLEHLSDIVKLKTMGQTAYVANAATRRRISRLMKDAGIMGTMELSGTTFVAPVLNGLPILRNDNLPDGIVWLVNFDADQGVGMWLGDNGTSAAGLADFSSQAAGPTGNVGGIESVGGIFTLIPIGWMPNRDRFRHRLVVDVAQSLISPLAIGALDVDGVIAS